MEDPLVLDPPQPAELEHQGLVPVKVTKQRYAIRAGHEWEILS